MQFRQRFRKFFVEGTNSFAQNLEKFIKLKFFPRKHFSPQSIPQRNNFQKRNRIHPFKRQF